MRTKYDVIILGAGLAGVSMACALKGAGLSIAIVEKHLPDFNVLREQNNRPISLAHGSYLILKKLELWDVLSAYAVPIHEVHVSEQGSFGSVRFLAKKLKVSALGYVVPLHLLHEMFYKRALEQTGVDIIPIEKLNAISYQNNEAAIDVQMANSNQILSAQLIIAADGAKSEARRLMNIPTKTEDHQDVALIAYLKVETPCPGVAYERFVKEGVIAILPMYDTNSKISSDNKPHAIRCVNYRMVWTMNQTQAHKVVNWNDAALLNFVQQKFGYRFKIISLSRAGQIPLQTILAHWQICDSFVLLGNSAHTIYPLAAQGFNLTLRDVAALARVLSSAKVENKFLGDKALLQKYVDLRLPDQQRIIQITKNLDLLFGLQLPLLSQLRAKGLFVIDLLPALKNKLAKRLMGHTEI